MAVGLASWETRQPAGWLVGWLSEWLGGLAGSLAGWLVYWLAGALVVCIRSESNFRNGIRKSVLASALNSTSHGEQRRRDGKHGHTKGDGNH